MNDLEKKHMQAIFENAKKELAQERVNHDLYLDYLCKSFFNLGYAACLLEIKNAAIKIGDSPMKNNQPETKDGSS